VNNCQSGYFTKRKNNPTQTMQTDGLGIRLSPYRYLHTTQNQIKMGEWDSILHSIHSHYSKKKLDILFEKLES
jgi:hypothetical protein